MGRIVGGFATSHVLFKPDGVEEQAQRVFNGMMAIREKIRALAPDLLVVASSDHLNNFTLKHQVTLAIGVADEFTPLGDMGIPQVAFAGHRNFAERYARYAAESGFDLVQAEEARPDHGLMLTKLIADPAGTWPVVPLFINTAMPVPPSPSRCFALGKTLKTMVELYRPVDERVVVVSGGGLSHWLRIAGQGKVAEHYDRHILHEFCEGRAQALAEIGCEELEAEAGNGGLELGAWLFMAGTLPEGLKASASYYESIPEWGSGMGGISFHV